MLNKIKTLREQMTLEEKIGMLHGNGFFRTEGIPRLGIPPLIMSDGPMGVRHDFPDANWTPVGLTNDYVTYFPSNMALAATWDRGLAYTFGCGLGTEARGRGKDVILGPGINIIRSPLCGRNFEYMSEDPYLIAQLVVPFIQGIQEQEVAACVKHFALNNQETDRLDISVEVSERALYEIYLPGFKAAVQQGKSLTIMGAYNRLRGTHCCHNAYLLIDILRKEWGFDGVVISDWGAVHDTEAAIQNGLDIEMEVTTTFDDYFFANPLIEKVKSGIVPIETIDAKVELILKVMEQLNMLGGTRSRGTYNLPKHREIALQIAEQSVVLLKNSKNILPLDPDSKDTILVVGENGNRIHSNGGGSAEIKALYEISPLLGLQMVLGGNVKIKYAKGYSSDKELTDEMKEALVNEALVMAKAADRVIYIGGLNHDFDGEGNNDKEGLELPYQQDQLIEKLLEIKPEMIIVNMSGSPVAMPWEAKCHTLIQSWYAGVETGLALANVIFGSVNPSGKLPMTYSRKLEECSAHSIGEFPGDKTVRYLEDLFVGYRHFDHAGIQPMFGFGHGLSYTTFEYSDLTLHREGSKEGFVSFQVTNTGQRAGTETAQLYISDNECTLVRPVKELKGFEKVLLQPGESKTVHIPFNGESLAYYDDQIHQWVVENGLFTLSIGASSQDLRLSTTLTLE